MSPDRPPDITCFGRGQDQLHIQRPSSGRELHERLHGPVGCQAVALCGIRAGIRFHYCFDLDPLCCLCVYQCVGITRHLSGHRPILTEWAHLQRVRYCACVHFPLLCNMIRFAVAGRSSSNSVGPKTCGTEPRPHSSLHALQHL